MTRTPRPDSAREKEHLDRSPRRVRTSGKCAARPKGSPLQQTTERSSTPPALWRLARNPQTPGSTRSSRPGRSGNSITLHPKGPPAGLPRRRLASEGRRQAEPACASRQKRSSGIQKLSARFTNQQSRRRRRRRTAALLLRPSQAREQQRDRDGPVGDEPEVSPASRRRLVAFLCSSCRMLPRD